MLEPKKMKYRKQMKGRSRNKGTAKRGTRIAFGDYALKALDHQWITARQIEATRKAIVRTLKRKGQIWIRIFPHKSVTFKGDEVSMGGGKGAVDHYVAPVKPGRIMFEIGGIEDEKLAREAFSKAADKLPIKTKVVTRKDYVSKNR